jgi:hypothetical protein
VKRETLPFFTQPNYPKEYDMTEEKKALPEGEKGGELEKLGVGTIAKRPTYLQPKDTRGTDHIERDDVQMPRIGLAQGLSPEVQEGDVKHIPELKTGDMFNNLTGQIYGRGPLEFTVVRADRPRGIEFIPLKEGGGIRDFSVPLNDPRMEFGEPDDENPSGKKPIATKFYDYIILLIPSMEVVALSFKSTGLKTAKRLNAFMKMKRAPSFTGKYTLTSTIETQGVYTYGVFQVRVSDAVDEYTARGMPGWVSEEVAEYAEGIFDSIKDKEFEIEREQVEQEKEDPTEGVAEEKTTPF